MKIIVDELPKTAKDCAFSEYYSLTNKHACILQHGMYSRCNLECNMECRFLKKQEATNV